MSTKKERENIFKASLDKVRESRKSRPVHPEMEKALKEMRRGREIRMNFLMEPNLYLGLKMRSVQERRSMKKLLEKMVEEYLKTPIPVRERK